METQVPAKCPGCGRLTVDNQPHCKEKKSSAWQKTCSWMKCVKCKTTYGPNASFTPDGLEPPQNWTWQPAI